jgi:hypothetical protein
MMVTISITVFWDVTVYTSNLVDTYRQFGGTCCLHLKGRRVSQAWKKYYEYRER